MYLLFRLHNILPKEYENMGYHEKQIMTAFVKQEIEDIEKELNKNE